MSAMNVTQTEHATHAFESVSKLPSTRSRLRVGTALVSPIGALAFTTIFQALFVVAVLLPTIGWNSTKLMAAMATPMGMFGLVVAAQLGFGLWPILAARFSTERFRERLALRRSAISGWAWPAILLATVAAAVAAASLVAIAVKLGWLPPIKGSQRELAELLQRMPVAWRVVFVLAGSVLPGVCEELLFRGYMQSRLLKRWSPAQAIGVTSVAIAVMHMDPTYMAFVLPIGVWLGYLAWRTNSILPGIACHAFVNFVFQGLHALQLASESDAEKMTWSTFTRRAASSSDQVVSGSLG